MLYDQICHSYSLFYTNKFSLNTTFNNKSNSFDFISLNKTTTVLNVFNLFTNLLTFLIFLFFIFITISVFFDKKVFFYVKKFSVFTDKRMFSLQDSLFFIFFYFLSVSTLLFFSLKVLNYFSIGYFFLLTNLLFVLTLILQVLLLFFFNTSLFTFSLLTGSLKSNTFFRNVFDDCFGVLAYVIKYLLQSARWGLILGVMFVTNESLYFSLSFFDCFQFDHTLAGASYTSVSIYSILLNIIMFVVEAFDTIFLLSIQSALFIILIFLVFSFMFSSSVSNYLEVLKR